MRDHAALSLAWKRFARARTLLVADALPQLQAVPNSCIRAVRVMIEALRSLSNSEAQRLRGLLECSDERMKPLRDPFRLQFGTHRWLDLAREREEAYSDWLAWLLQGLNSAADILRIFELDADPFGRLVGTSGIAQVSREEGFRTPQGERKKLDLVVRFENGGVLLVEIKVRPLEEAGGSENLPIYLEHLRMEQPEPELRRAVLLLPDMADVSFEGWLVTSWDQVSLVVRQFATRYCRPGVPDLLRAAMFASFAGAVEQNVLKLGQTELSAPQIAAYIERFLAKAQL